MNTDDLHEFCRSWLKAWTGNRPLDLIQFYAPDAYYCDPARPTGLRGTEQLLEYFTKLLMRNPDWVWRVQEIIPTAEGCVLRWVATIPTESSSMTVDGVDIIELRGDKITRNEVYFDRTVLMQR